MKLVPLGEKVVVRRLEAEEVTTGGIVLPDSAKEKPKQGRVLSVGDGRLLSDGTRVKLTVQEGDRVLFHSYAGTEVKVDDGELLIMSEDEILAVLNGSL
jgi:chaperonin GroES